MCPSSRATPSIHSGLFPPPREQARNPACSDVLGTNPAVVAPAQALGQAYICERIRGCCSQVGQSSATSFPPPLWGRDRERGTTASLLARVYKPTNPAKYS